tara:strand:+ start:284 stop:1072 length:789 start_codon:yes stop_codon:yes gene_type:complete
MFEDEYPHIAHAIHAVETLVADYKARLAADEEVELEVRFGTMNEGKFVAGITLADMEKMIARLATNAAISTHEWVEHHDFFYAPTQTILNRQPDCGTVRTRVKFNCYNLDIEKVTVTKTKLREVIVKTANSDQAVRIVLSRERTIPEELLPNTTATSHVRIQTRKVAEWAHDSPQAAWRYDFSLTWAADTRSQAERLKKDAPPRYEFELELLASPYLQKHTDRYIATSMLLKSCDFDDKPNQRLLVRQSDFTSPLHTTTTTH